MNLPEIQYEDYIMMIRDRAHCWNKILSRSNLKGVREKRNFWEELFSVGNLAFCEAKDTYDPNKGTFSVWLYRYLDNYMRNHLVKSSKICRMEECFEHIDAVSVQEKRIEKPNFLTEFLSSVSEEAKEIINIALNTPAEYAEFLSHEIMKVADLKRCMAQKGMKQYTINVTVAEIRERLREGL